MKILLVTPAPPGSRTGNRRTALRWAAVLKQLGHRTEIVQEYRGESCDVMIALHARRSFPSVRRFHREHPDLPLIVALTGTDVYGDIRSDARAQQSLEMASRIIVLQPLAIRELPRQLQKRAHVVIQSARKPAGNFQPRKDVFQICVLGHLRPVKDPFRAALAARLLPASSRIRIVHVGGALSQAMRRQARSEMHRNPRYRWLGDLPHGQALRELARSHVHVLSSKMEGGANALCEAIACGVPTLASRIPGSIGILGSDYPGYFDVGDTRALAGLLQRAEGDPAFLHSLRAWCKRLEPLINPTRERDALRVLIGL